MLDRFMKWTENDFETYFTPPTDVYEENDNYLLVMDIPGVKKEDVNVTMDDDVLTIEGERKINKKDFGRFERFNGKFLRKFIVDESIDIDNISAEITDGVLTLTLPKSKELKDKKKKIEVK